MAQTIEKIKLYKADRQGVIDSGELVADGASLEFRGKKGTLQMSPVRDVAWELGLVRIEFGEGDGVRSVVVGDFRSGALKIRSQNRMLVSELQSVLELKELTEAETATRQSVERMVAEAGMRRARVQMWISGLVAVAGTVATIVGYSTAQDGGGTYYVFWGAILFGIGGFLAAYFDQYRKHRRTLEDAGGGGPGGG
jgi:hypothetical protein